MQKEQAAYALGRLPIGMSFLVHGLVRLPKLSLFADGLTKGFANTWLPAGLVHGFATILPFVELLLGILLLLGLAMRLATAAGVCLMCMLIFGTGLQENWSAVAIQLFYGVYFAVLHLFAGYNGYALKNYKNRGHGSATDK